ncbi:MAG: hypothetical protein H0W62_08370 [Chitinophagales bacterium]|nr:hypothetical protein [Chitinophagales bacterium]
MFKKVIHVILFSIPVLCLIQNANGTSLFAADKAAVNFPLSQENLNINYTELTEKPVIVTKIPKSKKSRQHLQKNKKQEKQNIRKEIAPQNDMQR